MCLRSFKMKSLLIVAIFLITVELSTSTNATQPKVPTNGKEFFLYSTVKENWFNALRFCHKNKWELLSLTKPEYESDLRQFLTLNSWDEENIWTSGNDLGRDFEGTYSWLSTGGDLDYTNWSPDQPNSNNGVAHCVRLTSYANLTWSVANCMTKMRFICEKNYYADDE